MRIIVDTREQKNSHILKYFAIHDIDYIEKKLDVADYQIEGKTDVVSYTFAFICSAMVFSFLFGGFIKKALPRRPARHRYALCGSRSCWAVFAFVPRNYTIVS